MRRLALIFMGITFILSSCGQNLELESIRTLGQGELIGLKGENSTYTWKGVPFAEPPVGELRWKETQKAKAWNGRLEATKF